MGVTAPNAIGVEAFQKALFDGKSGIHFWNESKDLGFRCQLGGVPPLTEAYLQKYLPPLYLKKINNKGNQLKKDMTEENKKSNESRKVLIGTACNIEQLNNIIAPFINECPIRYNSKAPIEIFYSASLYLQHMFFATHT